MEQIVDIKNFNISSLSLTNPLQRSNGYGFKLIYDGSDFRFQLPLCVVLDVNIKGDKSFIYVSFKFSDNFDYFQFFCIVYEMIIKHLCRYSTKQDYDILKNTDGSPEEIRESFKTTAKKINSRDMGVSMKIQKNTLFFDKTKREISGLEIKPGDTVVCMIKTNGVSVDETTAGQTWVCTQCLKWNK